MVSTVNYKLFDSREDIKEHLVNYFLSLIQGKQKINIALSGGGSPKWYLSGFINKNINWGNIFISQVDERCVPPDDDQSNYKMLKETLFNKINIPPENIFRIKGEADPFEEAIDYGKHILDNNIKFDIIILGMGNDGHTASIFPNQDYLFNYYKITGVTQFPHSDQKRITLTEETINKSSNKIFIVDGEDKEEKLKEIFVEGNKNLPAARIKDNVLWLLNKNSSKFLNNKY